VAAERMKEEMNLIERKIKTSYEEIQRASERESPKSKLYT
jgi:hypothetical protein